MKQKKYIPYLVSILGTLAIGGLSSIAVMTGLPAYEGLIKPPLTPPAAAFPVVWSILFVLMGIGAARIWLSGSNKRRAALALYGIQLTLNALWSVWFFGFQARFFAFIWLLMMIAAIVLMIKAFSKVDPLDGRIQIPYLLWSLFAAYLNFAVWYLNR